jgi:hypothetical protein
MAQYESKAVEAAQRIRFIYTHTHTHKYILEKWKFSVITVIDSSFVENKMGKKDENIQKKDEVYSLLYGRKMECSSSSCAGLCSVT